MISTRSHRASQGLLKKRRLHAFQPKGAPCPLSQEEAAPGFRSHSLRRALRLLLFSLFTKFASSTYASPPSSFSFARISRRSSLLRQRFQDFDLDHGGIYRGGQMAASKRLLATKRFCVFKCHFLRILVSRKDEFLIPPLRIGRSYLSIVDKINKTR